jgi:hypothetical protein
MQLETISVRERLGDDKILRLAREIAADIHPLDKILNLYSISAYEYESISKNAYFNSLVSSEREAFLSATNTYERVKLKSAVAVEEWLPQLFRDMHDSKQSLLHRIEGGKLLAKLAGMGIEKADVNASSERFTININMGSGDPVKIEKNVSPTSKVIEHDYDADDA